jgi:hypothetical protein
MTMMGRVALRLLGDSAWSRTATRRTRRTRRTRVLQRSQGQTAAKMDEVAELIVDKVVVGVVAVVGGDPCR